MSPHHQAWARLPSDAQDKLDMLVRTIGVQATAKALGCGTATIDAIWGGGRAKTATIERVKAALER